MDDGVAGRGPLPPRADSAALAVGHVNDTSGLSGDGWARLATAIQDLRTAGRCDVLLHAGDVNLGVPADRATARLMNRLRFDAVVPGNHDLDGGLESLAAQRATLHAPLLCANVTGAGAVRVRPYRWVRRRGLPLAGPSAGANVAHHAAGIRRFSARFDLESGRKPVRLPEERTD